MRVRALPLTEVEKRRFSAVYENTDFPSLRGRGFVRALFSDCTFHDIRKVHFVNCTMENCRIETEDPRDLLEATITINCHTFRNLKLSPAAFDALLFVISMAAPDEDMRTRSRTALDPSRLKLYERIFPELE
jgi:hypothetical protein